MLRLDWLARIDAWVSYEDNVLNFGHPDVMDWLVDALVQERDAEEEEEDAADTDDQEAGDAWDAACALYFSASAYPFRSTTHHTRRIGNHAALWASLTRLRTHGCASQRTPEWYAERAGMITASNAYKVFGPEGTRNSLLYEK